MAETITITQPETGPEAPQEEAQDNQSERPEWLPEKFKTPEDLAKSYSELEKKTIEEIWIGECNELLDYL